MEELISGGVVEGGGLISGIKKKTFQNEPQQC